MIKMQIKYIKLDMNVIVTYSKGSADISSTSNGNAVHLNLWKGIYHYTRLLFIHSKISEVSIVNLKFQE